ncbi:unnamed protein product [Spirodela intermedia]|uniref:UspA domain-containing protein n=1 Tax=Spirodela intermedia TaxID=51605 RepID=A0A7I8KYS1_SPIIN|nr:unnamed protein product [Spirodela intermedia]
MEEQRVVVLVEEADAAVEALRWAVRNFLRRGDTITLLHVLPASRSRKRQRLLRLRGFQLALSFRDLCSRVPEAKVEIVVKEGEQAVTVAALVSEIRASVLILGLHEHSFLYKFSTAHFSVRNLDCRILAVKNHPTDCDGFVGVEFSQVEIARLCMRPQKIPYRILPVCFRRKSRKKRRANG